MWATEAEAAILSGFSPEAFRKAAPKLEQAGFPQITRWNGKRFIPAIINFWACQIDASTGLPVELAEDDLDGPNVENFGHARSQRRFA